MGGCPSVILTSSHRRSSRTAGIIRGVVLVVEHIKFTVQLQNQPEMDFGIILPGWIRIWEPCDDRLTCTNGPNGMVLFN